MAPSTLSDASVASVESATAESFETRTASVSPSVQEISTFSSEKLESPPLFAGKPSDTAPTCSVSASASSRLSSKSSLSVRATGSYQSHFACRPARPIWFENCAADPAPIDRGPYSTTVMSADQIVTSAADTDGATSSSSTVSDAAAPSGASCQPGPDPRRIVTRLSFSETASAAVGKRARRHRERHLERAPLLAAPA